MGTWPSPNRITWRSLADWQRMALTGELRPDAHLYDPQFGRWLRAADHPRLRCFFQTRPLAGDLLKILGVAALAYALYWVFKQAANKDLQGLARQELRMAIFRRDDCTCTYCGHRGNAATLEVDHDLPVCRGGSDDPSNLKTACWSCNVEKGTRTGIEYRIWRWAGRGTR